jgi:transcriptional regulator with XRE-family HTH domain
MPATTNNIASRIRHAREQAQMPPAELRKLLREDYGIDLSKTGLHRLETVDAKNPNLKQIQAIAKITRVSPSWILFGEGTSVPGDEVGAAIRSRVIDTIELMLGALDLNARQESTINNWLKSVRENSPKNIRKP